MSDAQTHAAEGTYLPTIANQRHLDAVLSEVAAERGEQDQKWGGPDHDDKHTPAEWREYIRDRVSAMHSPLDHVTRHGLVQIAALAVAAIQSIDRKREARPSGTS